MAFVPGTLGAAVTPQTFAPMLNVSIGGVYTVTLNPASAGAATTSTQQFSNLGLGLQVGDVVFVSQTASPTQGVAVVNAFVSAADTLSVTFLNATAGALTPFNGSYQVTVLRPDASLSRVTPAIQP